MSTTSSSDINSPPGAAAGGMPNSPQQQEAIQNSIWRKAAKIKGWELLELTRDAKQLLAMDRARARAHHNSLFRDTPMPDEDDETTILADNITVSQPAKQSSALVQLAGATLVGAAAAFLIPKLISPESGGEPQPPAPVLQTAPQNPAIDTDTVTELEIYRPQE